MPSYSLSVALFDFLPILATGLGLGWLARGISRRHRALAPIAWASAVAIPLGGVCKASWKLIVALGYPPIGWLENLLFIALAPGFVALAFAMHHARRAWASGIPAHAARFPGARLLAWLAVPLVGGLVWAALDPGGRLWFFWLLGVTTCANAALVGQAVVASRWSGLSNAVSACFAYNFAATLTMAGLARLPAGEASAWLQEGVNLSAQVALAVGCWHLGRRMQESV